MNRRAFLGGAVALPVLAIAAVPVAAAVTTSDPARDAAAWSSALARYDRSEADFNTAVSAFGDAEERYFALRGEMPFPPYREEGETQDGLLARVAAYKELDERCTRQAGYDEAKAAEEAASGDHEEALAALFAVPSPDLTAAIRKLELADQWSKDEGVTAVLSDLRRLAGEGR